MPAFIEDKNGNRRPCPKGYILKDGEALIVGVAIMDGQSSNVIDGFGRPAGSRPGFAFAADPAAGGRAREEAFAERSAVLKDAWRNSSAAPAASPANDGRQKAWDARGDYLKNAWKGAA